MTLTKWTFTGYKKSQLIPNNKLNTRMVDYMDLLYFNNHVSYILYSSVDLIVGYMTCEVPEILFRKSVLCQRMVESRTTKFGNYHESWDFTSQEGWSLISKVLQKMWCIAT